MKPLHLETPPPEFSYQNLKERFIVCRGEGFIISKDLYQGRLNFTFTSRNDSSYLQFRDLLGRRALFIQIIVNDMKVWDMLDHKQYSHEQILLRFPFLKVMKPHDLTQALWGNIPVINKGMETSDFNFDQFSTNISFHSSPTRYGSLVNQIVFRMNEGQVILEIIRREFGLSYSHLMRSIPTMIP